MSKNDQEHRLCRLIARQVLSTSESAWLTEHIQRGMDWNYIIRKASYEGLLPLMYAHCRERDLLKYLPHHDVDLMKRIYAESMLINRHLLKVLKDLDYGLAEKGIRAIVLKGAALLNTVYKDIALRPMEDIDVMVRPENIHDLKEILEQMGFLQNTSYPYSFQRGILSVDIHFDFLSSHRISSRREVMDICREHVWESAVPFDSKPALRRLSINNHFLALSFHLLKHRYDRLIWFVDIAESILKYESALNWSNLIHYAGQVKGDRILLYVLILMKHLIGGFLPEEVLIELGKGKLSTVEQYILRLRLMDAPLGRLTDLLWLYQIRGIRKKIGFLRENLFQTGNYESDISRVTKRKVRISRKIRHGFVASSIGCPVDDQKSVKAITAFFVI